MDRLLLDSLFTEDLYFGKTATTIVITKPWSDLNEQEKDQLTRITEALRQRVSPALGLQAFRVVSTSSLDLSSWSERPEKLMYFGPPVKGLANYEVIEANGTRMVLSESLSDLIPNEASRTKLWAALKQLFSS